MVFSFEAIKYSYFTQQTNNKPVPASTSDPSKSEANWVHFPHRNNISIHLIPLSQCPNTASAAECSYPRFKLKVLWKATVLQDIDIDHLYHTFIRSSPTPFTVIARSPLLGFKYYAYDEITGSTIIKRFQVTLASMANYEGCLNQIRKCGISTRVLDGPNMTTSNDGNNLNHQHDFSPLSQVYNASNDNGASLLSINHAQHKYNSGYMNQFSPNQTLGNHMVPSQDPFQSSQYFTRNDMPTHNSSISNGLLDIPGAVYQIAGHGSVANIPNHHYFHYPAITPAVGHYGPQEGASQPRVFNGMTKFSIGNSTDNSLSQPVGAIDQSSNSFAKHRLNLNAGSPKDLLQRTYQLQIPDSQISRSPSLDSNSVRNGSPLNSIGVNRNSALKELYTTQNISLKDTVKSSDDLKLQQQYDSSGLKVKPNRSKSEVERSSPDTYDPYHGPVPENYRADMSDKEFRVYVFNRLKDPNFRDFTRTIERLLGLQE